jgi:general secretion pathway protein K
VDPTETATIVDSIMDWLDDNDEHRLNGVESEYYAHLPVPYRAKNGPCDRVEELLLVRGITRRLFDGGTTNDVARPGFCELLTTAPSGRVNVNTASAPVLQIMFDLDEAGAAAVVARRDGPDGVAGTSDDQPYRNVAAFISEVGGSDPALQRLWSQRATVRSATFVVTATGEVAGIRRTITARLQRQNQDFLVTGWVERRGGP